MPRPSKLTEEAKKQAWAAAHLKVVTMPEAAVPDAIKLVRGFMASGITALVGMGLSEYLALAGVTDSMNAARVVLAMTGLVAFIGVVVSELLWGKSRRWKLTVITSAGVILVAAFIALDSWTVRYRIAHAPQSIPNTGPVGVGVHGKGATMHDVHIDGFGSTQVRVNDGASLNMKGDSSIAHGKIGVENNGGQINMEDHASIHDNDKNVVLNAPKKKATVTPPPQP